MIDLDAIKARCEAASGEPWREWTHSDGTYRIYGAGCWGVAEMTAPGGGLRENDMEFIAHSRADVPALVAEVERLQRKLHDEQVRRDEWEKMYNQAIAEPAPDALPCGRGTVAQDCQAGQCSHLRVLFGMGCSGPNRKDRRHACIHPHFDGDLQIIPPPPMFGSTPWTPEWCPLIESDTLPCGHPREDTKEQAQ